VYKLIAYAKLARPHQYIKNGFIWIPIFFGYRLHDAQAVAKTFLTFVAFCLTASAMYVFNDLRDVNEDREHPVKKFRPLASGRISSFEAILFLFVLLALSVCFCVFFIRTDVIIILAGYILLNFAYSYKLKHFAVIDLICISFGFVLRVFAGGLAAEVWVSHWLVLMIFLLAVFLVLTKRRDDLLLNASGRNCRKSLSGYNMEFVNFAMVSMSSVIIVCYILYTVSPEVIDKHGTDKLFLTTFWVIVGLLRYMQITFVEQKSGSPTLVVFKDCFMQAVIFLWVLHFYLILYVFRNGLP